MAPDSSSQNEFLCRVRSIRNHGLGLSVDVHAPEITSLLRRLQARQVPPEYLEVFHAGSAALASVRNHVDDGLLTYHGEGLWVTQPEDPGAWAFKQEVHDMVEHLRILQSAWLNHECAMKYFAGYAYGTYLPPLYTQASAEVVADNLRQIQTILDTHCQLANGATPLVLLEMPPLTYFVAGTIPIPTFFQIVTELSPCGLVLDIGHLWTVYRYSGVSRTMSLAQFVDAFLNAFPLDRVVEIHVAGLAVHESQAICSTPVLESTIEGVLPAWTDAHAAPIPPVLFEMLDRILSHPQLTNLRGLALEVDTKPIELIVDEFANFSMRYSRCFQRMSESQSRSSASEEKPSPNVCVGLSDRQALVAAYDQYARILIGEAEPSGVEWHHHSACYDEIDLYRSTYLPYEILHWGGNVKDMFADTCRQLDECGVSLDKFVRFWFREPRTISGPYDFFLLKVERFVEFIREVAPGLQPVAEREAAELRLAYQQANEPSVATPVT